MAYAGLVNERAHSAVTDDADREASGNAGEADRKTSSEVKEAAVVVM